VKALARTLFGLLLCLAIIGCRGDLGKFSGIDLTGIQGYGTDFRLTDHTGKARTLADFRGKVVTLFFGYTHCPDVCPTTLSDMRQVMEKLGKDSERVQVLFVTLDPGRDTPELLARYVPAFHPSFLGLYGDAETTAKTAKDFKIFYQLQPGKTPETYTVDHTAGTLVFDPQGHLRLFLNYGLSSDLIASDIRILLKQ
jgi:protein SCO1/2